MFSFLLSIIAATGSAPPIEFRDRVVFMSEIPYAIVHPRGELLMDVAFPIESPEPLPAVIFVHSGGWAQGQRQEMREAIHIMAQGGYFAATIDYRLTAEAGFPAAVHDCKAAIRFLRTNAEDLHIDPDRIGIVGFSAGGHLATLVGMSQGVRRLDGTINGRKVSTAVACVGSISGIVAPQLATGEVRNAYRQWVEAGSGVRTSTTIPQTYLDSKDPPMYILCGQNDLIYPIRHTKLFVEALKSAGIEHHLDIVKDAGHTIDEASAYQGLMSFLDAHLGGRANGVLGAQLLLDGGK